MSAFSHNRKRRSLRRALMDAVTPGDISEIMKLQVFLARKGDPVAANFVFDRVIGKPTSVLDVVHGTSQGLPDMSTYMPGNVEAQTMDSLTAPPPRALPAPDPPVAKLE